MSDDVRFPYQDPSLSPEQRTSDLLGRMSLEDKAGLLFHQLIVAGDLTTSNPAFGIPSVSSLITRRRMNHFNVFGSPPTGREFALWHNAVQRIAAELPLGIPVTLSSDPRHSFTNNPATAMLAGPFSQWPEPLGLAAIGSEDAVERFADIARREYLAVGLRASLHPQIDLVTEPRWARGSGTFGEDADLTSRLVAAYIRGFQGKTFGPGSVSTIVKHFPGGGPQKDGHDPHFTYGREQIYPGGRFEYHLQPFIAALAAGGRQVMPYYGMPVGTQYDEVGFGYNKSIITGILRERLGFDGVVCTDWGLLTDVSVMGTPMPAKAWGVEHLTREQRILQVLAAGADQFGGELCTDLVIGLVQAEQLTEERVNESARRLLREKFLLGLFDNPYIDAKVADTIVGNPEFRAAGLAAQRDAMTLLTNQETADGPMLPLTRGQKLYIEGVRAELVEPYGTVVSSPEDADVAILRTTAPWTPGDGGFDIFFHNGSLAFPTDEVARLQAIMAAVPTVVDIHLDRPAILTELVEPAAAIIANFGASDEAVLAVLFGDSTPKGSLPFDLPRSMAAVEASHEDAPFDTLDPLFRFGHGLDLNPLPALATSERSA
jgi:beta-glucosidase